eukprot:5287116-Prymnesium_polylepis.1
MYSARVDICDRNAASRESIAANIEVMHDVVRFARTSAVRIGNTVTNTSSAVDGVTSKGISATTHEHIAASHI